MSGSLIPLRFVVGLMAALIGLGFLLGVLHWNPDRLACFGGYGFRGPWHVMYAVGKLEIRAHAYTCDESDLYDPKTARPSTGEFNHRIQQ